MKNRFVFVVPYYNAEEDIAKTLHSIIAQSYDEWRAIVVDDMSTGERINHVSFYSPEADNARRSAMIGNTTALNDYNKWFNTVIENLPGVFHYSWYDLERKMRLYRDYWTRHWESLSGKTYEDTAQSNMMFDVPWSQVTDDMIKTRAAEFKSKLGGWIWHRKWDGTTTTPHLTINRSQPKIMLNRMK